MKKITAMENVAFRSGSRAFAAGKSRKDCPYSGERLIGKWLDGFFAAQVKGRGGNQ